MQNLNTPAVLVLVLILLWCLFCLWSLYQAGWLVPVAGVLVIVASAVALYEQYRELRERVR